jgi:FkbM family methyltransferase
MIIRNWLKRLLYLVNNVLALLNLRLTNLDGYNKLLLSHNQKFVDQQKEHAIDFISAVKEESLTEVAKNIKFSKSQIVQDLFVLSELNFKKNGFFVEFGATNGLTGSNTFLLEKNFDWNGILAEPAKQWHAELSKNRHVFIEKDCVWRASNETLIFNEIGGLSTIDNFSNSDHHSLARTKGHKYKVNTISLIDLLDKYGAPRVIDYLSIDTEGSEFEILSTFNFKKYKFKVITCEHNFTSNREKIFNLLTDKGYVRKYSDVSKFDDWFVLEEMI